MSPGFLYVFLTPHPWSSLSPLELPESPLPAFQSPLPALSPFLFSLSPEILLGDQQVRTCLFLWLNLLALVFQGPSACKVLFTSFLCTVLDTEMKRPWSLLPGTSYTGAMVPQMWTGHRYHFKTAGRDRGSQRRLPRRTDSGVGSWRNGPGLGK